MVSHIFQIQLAQLRYQAPPAFHLPQLPPLLPFHPPPVLARPNQGVPDPCGLSAIKRQIIICHNLPTHQQKPPLRSLHHPTNYPLPLMW